MKYTFLSYAAIALCLGACTANYTPKTDVTGLSQVRETAHTRIYSKPGFKTAVQYDTFHIAPVQTLIDDPAVREKNTSIIRSLEGYFYSRVVSALKERGFTVTNQATDKTVNVQLLITGLKPQGQPIEFTGIQQTGTPLNPSFETVTLSTVPDFSTVTIEAKFLNAVTNELDAVAVVNKSGGGIGHTVSEWGHVITVFDQWAQGFADTMLAERQASLQ